MELRYLWGGNIPAHDMLAFDWAGRDAQNRIKRAISNQARDQRYNADQLGVMPKACALIHEKPDQQSRAYKYPQCAVNCAFVCFEHWVPLLVGRSVGLIRCKTDIT